jgi:hypothetical protein
LSASFDDPNLVSVGGLAPAVALAQGCRLGDLVAAKLTLKASGGVNAAVKVPALVAGMVAGADSIADMDLLRHGGMARLFAGIRAPSTLGTFLRAFTFGHVRQLDSVAAGFLVNLAGSTPLLPGAERVAYVDLDDTVREVFGYAKQGSGYGYTGVKGLNALLATISTPLAAPVIAAARLRRGAAFSPRGASRLLAEALRTVRAAGAGGLVVVRADSAYYIHDIVAAARRAGARFSITARMTATVSRAIAGIPESAWTPIRYAQAVWDDEERRWISDAEVAEVPFTAFTGRRRAEHIPGRLIVRRVKRLNPAAVPSGQGELFTTWRHHAVFTDSPQPMLEAEATHRRHAVIEQVIGVVRGELRLAGAGRDRVQPHPRRRRPGLQLPREGHHRHHPHPADRRAGPAGPLRPTAAAAPAPRLALAHRLDRALRRHLRTTHRSDRLTTPPAHGTKKSRSGRAGQTGGSPTRTFRSRRAARTAPAPPRSTVDLG